MALVKPIIYQVVGYQNSGKTTFLLKLIQVLKNDGFKTVTIKHHGHGGRPDVPLQKDSSKHLEAGASAALVEGEGRLVLQADESSWSLDEQIRLMNFFQPDMILIEGHKHQAYPKILLLRDENDLSLLTKVDNIKAVIVWSKTLMEMVRERLNVQTFQITEEKTVKAVSNLLKKQVRSI